MKKFLISFFIVFIIYTWYISWRFVQLKIENNEYKDDIETLRRQIWDLDDKIDNLKEQDERYIKEESWVFLKQAVYSDIVFNNQIVDMKVGQKIDVDISTFEFLSWWFAKDKNKILFKGVWLDNIDVNSFQVIDNKYARDKNYIIQIEDNYLFIISNNSKDFKISNNELKTKKEKITCLWKYIEIPQNWTFKKRITKDYSCSYTIVPDFYLYLFTWGKVKNFPVYFHFSVLKAGEFYEDGTKIDDFYNVTLEDEKEIQKWKLMYFIYEWTWNRYYWIKIGDASYRITIDGWNDIIYDLDYEWEAYSIPWKVWDWFEKDIEKAFLSLQQ